MSNTDPKEIESAQQVHVLPKIPSTGFGFLAEYHIGIDEIELIPMPTRDPLDPVNFSKWEKRVTLGMVMFMYFLFTYLTTTTVPSFSLLQAQYSLSYAQVNWTVAIPALGLAIGPLFWSSVADIYGRRIILIAGTLIAFLATIWSAVATNYANYMVSRFLQGWGVSPAATVGLAVINDLFFEHERGKKVGLWVLAIDTGLLVGPLVGGFMSLVSQQWVAWLTAILFGLLLLLEVLFLPETLYPRKHMLSQPLSGNEKEPEKSAIKCTKQLPFLNLQKVPGVDHPKPWDAALCFLKLWSFPNVFVIVFSYCFAWYWWILSVITYLPAAYPNYKPEIQGLLFLGLILGTVASEILCSGALGDIIMLKFAKANGGSRLAECRLWLIYPAVIFSAVGLILWGISVDKGYHWIVGQVAFFLFAAGVQVGNTAVVAYIVDCYPQHVMSVVTFYSVLLNLSAFVNPFFIAPWVDKVGYTWTFSGQALISLTVIIPVTIIVHIFGVVWRKKRGDPSWAGAGHS
ncbi:MFS general substrate transporter [Terfezia boudieri ATCC MYA-4762]|uniref:MFS general substrate transporter n=1 Tax=Terfezia boudieri ATCC MYA-4762 TaxID=1051890 RepID=A0A3N4M493_9PEZI|nr:MFS general substrate transporter [Terfezia boudieri ATCC MYA-4762]